MTQIKLIPYYIRVKKQNSRDNYLLDSIPVESMPKDKIHSLGLKEKENPETKSLEVDFFDILKSYIKKYESIEFSDNKGFNFENRIFRDEGKRYFLGRLWYGEFGYSADFVNIDTKERILGARTEKDTEQYPMFFHIYLPKGKAEGYIIFQSFGIHSAKTSFEKTLKEFIKDLELTVDINAMISKDLFKELENSRILEVSLIKKVVPKDKAEKIHKGSVTDIFEARTFRCHRNKSIRLPEELVDILKNTESDYFELFDEQYDEIKTVVKIKGSNVTLNLEPRNKRCYESLVLDSIRLEQGHPVISELKEKSQDYMDYIKEKHGEKIET
ncbi:hypothetical protein [Methanolacinia paynteri]|uniref:hypothetical protein n=1 Tax=Methanolacinia paynteri TaxID=230356 RepID=UPI00064EF83B|nr:hypothetical protein [Methanolacinia paynteri]